jgi:uncharacterized membrane protein YkvA (DUF1232 family)
VSYARLALRLLREPEVPRLAKALPVLGLAYVVLPLDIVPDVLPLIGQIDDLSVVWLILTLFLKVCPVRALDFHRTAIAERRTYSPMPIPNEVVDPDLRRENARPWGTPREGASPSSSPPRRE